MLGYGDTDKPEDPSEYTTKKLCRDLSDLLDLLGVKKAVVIGHDWGAFTAARFALWHPDRLLALVILSVPYTPPSPVHISVEEVAKRAPDLAYMIFFNDRRSTKIIESNLESFVRLTYRRPQAKRTFSLAKLGTTGLSNPFKDFDIPNDDLVLTPEVRKALMTSVHLLIAIVPQELNIVRNELQKGMNGPLNYYRTAKLRHDEELEARLSPNLRPDLPVLFVWGTRDSTTTTSVIEKAHRFVPRIQDLALEGRGHWLMVEAKDEITEKVLSWLEGLMEKPERRGKL
ncbi:hypothetical protein V5O48_001282 [Marasmius crinis-equi]|uniref:AB hydrolase-1 domain-containing protein n=1 Tax=Marasmius crinis-equi TaxID=585013 RepID=A0ABR3FYV3_9AGAR